MNLNSAVSANRTMSEPLQIDVERKASVAANAGSVLRVVVAKVSRRAHAVTTAVARR